MVMLGEKSSSTQTESSASAAHGELVTISIGRDARPWCDHCKKPGHLKETCWKLHGKPEDWNPKMDKEIRGYTTMSGDKPTAAAEIFSMEQIELVKKLISQHQPHTVRADLLHIQVTS